MAAILVASVAAGAAIDTLAVLAAPARAEPAAPGAAPDAAGNWPGWRGTNGSGVSEEKGFPIAWSSEQGVMWKTELAGSGNSSPVVWGDRVFLTTAEDGGARRSVLCFDRANGHQLWKCSAPSDAREGTHAKNGFASATPALDGQRAYAFFGSAGVIAADFSGRLVWHRDLGPFLSDWGIAGSPLVYRNLVVINGDQDGPSAEGPSRSFLIALDRDTGETVWRTERPDQPRSWSSPVLVTPEGSERPELVLNGGNTVRAYDPETGAELWRCAGMTEWVTPTVVAGDGLVYAVSGKNGPTLAIRPGGRGDVTQTHVVWRAKRGGPYIPSPIFSNGRLYMVNDGGIITCFGPRDGKVVFQDRLPPSSFSSSLLAADGRLYIVNEEGDTFVLAARDRLEILGTNSLGERCLATPALSRGNVFVRTEKHLWCLGQGVERGVSSVESR